MSRPGRLFVLEVSGGGRLFSVNPDGPDKVNPDGSDAPSPASKSPPGHRYPRAAEHCPARPASSPGVHPGGPTGSRHPSPGR